MFPISVLWSLRACRVAVGALVVALLCSQVLTASAQTTIYLPNAGVPAEPAADDAGPEPPQEPDDTDDGDDGNGGADEVPTEGPIAAEAFNATTWTVQNNLGVGTESPTDRIAVQHSANSIARLRINNSSGGTSAGSSTYLRTGSGKGVALVQYGPGYTGTWDGVLLANRARLRTDASTTAMILTTGGNAPLIFGTNDDERARISENGSVGIGTSAPAHRLAVIGGPLWTQASWTGAIELGNKHAIGWRKNAIGWRFGMGHDDSGFFIFRTIGDPGTTVGTPAYDLTISNVGRVGIGTSTPLDRLHVSSGNIRTDGNIIVDGSVYVTDGNFVVSNGSFIDDGIFLNVPDYVFEPEYPLLSLDELRAFIAQEKHLPNVPSEEEIKAEGIDLGAFHMRLLEKVEELTLYTLAQDEQIQSQGQELTAQAQEMDELRQMVDLLRQQNQTLETRLAALEEQE